MIAEKINDLQAQPMENFANLPPCLIEIPNKFPYVPSAGKDGGSGFVHRGYVDIAPITMEYFSCKDGVFFSRDQLFLLIEAKEFPKEMIEALLCILEGWTYRARNDPSKRIVGLFVSSLALRDTQFRSCISSSRMKYWKYRDIIEKLDLMFDFAKLVNLLAGRAPDKEPSDILERLRGEEECEKRLNTHNKIMIRRELREELLRFIAHL